MRVALFAALLALAAVPDAMAVTSGPVRASTYASYPPSCLSAPLTDQPSGPLFTGSTRLTTANPDTNAPLGFETVDYTFWRVACEGGKSALLLRISRRPDAAPGTAVVLWNPDLRATQDGHAGSIRLATEPGTLSSSLQYGARIFSSVTVVLENFAQDIAYRSGAVVPQALPAFVQPARFDFNRALDVSLPDASTIAITPPPPAPPPVAIPAYDPQADPNARLSMPLSGFNSGNYFDPQHPGEGMLVEVSTLSDTVDPPLRSLNVAWFTYDTNGNPLWLFGSHGFAAGERRLFVVLSTYSGAAFAGASAAAAQSRVWGGVSIAFPDCTTMEFAYGPVEGVPTPAPLPSASGNRTWTRLSQPSGLDCR